MQQLREDKDADRHEFQFSATQFPVGDNQHPVICGTCGETFYADRQMHERTARSIDEGLDNPFECDDCRDETEELAHRDQ